MSDVLSQDLDGTFTHWVRAEFVNSVSVGDIVIPKSNLMGKPVGLWISWNNGWEDWCSSEQPDWIGVGHNCFSVSLRRDLKLWLIDSMDDFMSVWSQFTDKPPIFSLPLNMFWFWLKERGYDGVALTNEGQWATRMNTFMYGWDCQCIVIFDSKNVTLTKVD